MTPTASAHRLNGARRKAAPASSEPAAQARAPHDLPPQPPSPNPNGDAPSSGAHATDTLNGRDQNGRFAKGNPGGPGNPFARRTAALRQAFSDAVTQEGLNILAQRLLLQAQNGDVAAAKLVLAYAIGKPVDPVNPDTLDQQEFQLFNQLPTPPKDVHRILNTLPAGLACQLIRILLPNTELQIKKLWWKKIQRDMKKEERRDKRRAARAAAPAPTSFTDVALSPKPAANGASPIACVQSSPTHPPQAAPSPNEPNGKSPAGCVPSSPTHGCIPASAGGGFSEPDAQARVRPDPLLARRARKTRGIARRNEDAPQTHPMQDPPSPNDPNGNGRRAAGRQPAVQATPRPNLPSDPPSANAPNGKSAVACVQSSPTHPTQDPPSVNGPNGKSRGPARRMPAVSPGDHPA